MRSLVPGLDADLARDQAALRLQDSCAQDVGAIGVAAGFREGSAAVVADRLLDTMGHVASADVVDPGSDLVSAVEDTRRAGLGEPVGEYELGILGVHCELGA